MAQVRAFLQENAVPDYLVDEMFRHASDDAYWLSAEDDKNLGFRSPSFKQFLTAKCAWDETMEHNAYAGRMAVDDFKRLLKCSDRATQDAAHQVLLAARQERSPRAIRSPDPAPRPGPAPPPSPAPRRLIDDPWESVPPRSWSG